MKRLITLLLIIVVSITSFSQSFGRYASRMTRDGMIYFLMPQKLKKVSGIRNFEYDVTLLSWSDSATVNFTFHADTKLLPEDLSITTGNCTIECRSYAPLFIDIVKNGYEIRISSRFSINNIEQIINSAVPPVFLFRQGETIESATYSPRAWKKDRQLLLKILDLYLYSK